MARSLSVNASGIEGRSPVLALDGFSGPLEHLLILARAQQVDLACIPIGDLVDQLAAALQQAPPTTTLAEKGDWVVMASWLLQLRSLLLLPRDSPVQQAAEQEAHALRERLVSLQAMQALGRWLDRRPQPGRDVFLRGQPELPGVTIEPDYEVDVIEFLWTSLTLFETARADTSTRYRPAWLELYSIPDARERILRRLAAEPEGQLLDTLLPPALVGRKGGASPVLLHRSAWSTTLIASLELAKQGDVALEQDGDFAPIRVRRLTD
jgi:segregation and condensation protein A